MKKERKKMIFNAIMSVSQKLVNEKIKKVYMVKNYFPPN
jgi:hypothetical protein